MGWACGLTKLWRRYFYIKITISRALFQYSEIDLSLCNVLDIFNCEFNYIDKERKSLNHRRINVAQCLFRDTNLSKGHPCVYEIYHEIFYESAHVFSILLFHLLLTKSYYTHNELIIILSIRTFTFINRFCLMVQNIKSLILFHPGFMIFIILSTITISFLFMFSCFKVKFSYKNCFKGRKTCICIMPIPKILAFPITWMI